MTKTEQPAPKDRFEAFHLLELLLEPKKTSEKKIIFFDELPWFDTAKSNFLQALEYFWNAYASAHNIT